MGQSRNVTFERCADLAENSESEISNAAFNATNVGAVDFGFVGQILLGPAEQFTALPNPTPKDF